MGYFVLMFVVGTVVGSFVNVLIDRSIVGEDWVRGRSHCDNCKKNLTWYDMIPIVSYLCYRGKSRCCSSPLTYRYPVVELLVGLLFVWWLVVGFWFFKLVGAPLTMIQPSFWLVTGVTLFVLALADLFYGVVLVPIVWFGSILAILYRLALWHFGAYQIVDLQNAVLLAGGFFAFFWCLWKATKGRGMADGDMYVALYMGLLLGWPKGVVALIGSFILGAIVGLLLMVTKVRSRKDSIPFVPFMVTAMGVAMLWGEQLIRYVN
jgi:leader peptidase (prepilin peptidase)/N-methyltransferase